MIIGINGYIGSGKDTVGKIIQELTTPSGVVFPTWEIKKFASKLKQIASLLTGIPVEKFEDQEFKKTYLGSEWDTTPGTGFYGARFLREDEYYRGDVVYKRTSVREFLQKLGTESIRNGLHTNAWVNALMSDYKPQKKFKSKEEFLLDNPDYKFAPNMDAVCWDEYPNWIITDCRFPNEAQGVEERDGKVVRVIRGNEYYGERREILDGRNNLEVLLEDSWYVRYWNRESDELIHVFIGDRMGGGLDTVIFENPSSMHPSETGLDRYQFDWYILNTKDIPHLIQEVKRMLHHFEIIPVNIGG